MRAMTTTLLTAGMTLLLVPMAGAGIGFDAAIHDRGAMVGIELWTDRGTDAVYDYGETVDLRFRTADDAYVVVYGVDADGQLTLLYPMYDTDRRFVRGGVTHVIESPFLYVGGSEGIVYVEALACRYPLEPRLPRFFYHHPYARPQLLLHSGRLVTSFGVVIGDPYLALAELRTTILPVGCAPEYAGYTTLSYGIHRPHYYPRYVCADCHYGGWYDPYYDTCSVFEIRIDAFWSPVHHYHVDRCQPRYYYWKRAASPVRYRDLKTRWSSKDDRAQLTRYFGGKAGRERDYLRARRSGEALVGGTAGGPRDPGGPRGAVRDRDPSADDGPRDRPVVGTRDPDRNPDRPRGTRVDEKPPGATGKPDVRSRDDGPRARPKRDEGVKPKKDEGVKPKKDAGPRPKKDEDAGPKQDGREKPGQVSGEKPARDRDAPPASKKVDRPAGKETGKGKAGSGAPRGRR